MRIDRSNATAGQPPSDLSSKKVAAQTAAQPGGVSREDHATLASDSTSVGSLVSAALHSPAVRQGKVDRLRQAITSGQYRIDPSSIAASMLGESA
jgi:negative regulator of flagellin synthesis FlgM